MTSIVSARPFSNPASPPTTESSVSSTSPEQGQKAHDFEPAVRIVASVSPSRLDRLTR